MMMLAPQLSTSTVASSSSEIFIPCNVPCDTVALTVAMFVIFPACVNAVVQLHIIDSFAANVVPGQTTLVHLSSLTFIFAKLTFPLFVTL